MTSQPWKACSDLVIITPFHKYLTTCYFCDLYHLKFTQKGMLRIELTSSTLILELDIFMEPILIFSHFSNSKGLSRLEGSCPSLGNHDINQLA